MKAYRQHYFLCSLSLLFLSLSLSIYIYIYIYPLVFACPLENIQ